MTKSVLGANMLIASKLWKKFHKGGPLQFQSGGECTYIFVKGVDECGHNGGDEGGDGGEDSSPPSPPS